MATVNDFKFDLEQKVFAERRGRYGVVISRQQRASGNDYEVELYSDDNFSCATGSAYIKEDELLPFVDISYPCPCGIASFVLILETGMVLKNSNHRPLYGSPYHLYRWDSKKGAYILDTACSCMRKGEVEGLE